MQSTPQAIPMEEIYIYAIFLILALQLCFVVSRLRKLVSLNLEISKVLQQVCVALEVKALDVKVMKHEITLGKDDICRSLLALRESLETTKPMKTNNWDSVREAFKGPVRIEVNERN